MAGKQDNNYRVRGSECWGDMACSKSYQFCSLIRHSIHWSAFNGSLNGLGDQKRAYSAAELPIVEDSICKVSYIESDISRINSVSKVLTCPCCLAEVQASTYPVFLSTSANKMF